MKGFDAKNELADFFTRHFDELIQSSLDVFTQTYPYSALNTLPIDERKEWVSIGLKKIIASMLGEDINTRRVYFPKVSELESVPYFGITSIIDSCECALLPDEALLPLLWEEYREESEKLFLMISEFRKAQNNQTKHQIVNLMKDMERQLEATKRLAELETREDLQRSIYQRFSLALLGMRGKTNELGDLLKNNGDSDLIDVCLAELKMLENDIVAEIFEIDPDLIFEDKREKASMAPRRFVDAAEDRNLTSREIEILEYVAEGYSNEEVSQTLSLASSTVKNYISNIFSKLGISSRAQAVVFAAKNGYFEQKTE